MRKLNLFLLSLLAVTFFACDDDDDNGNGNGNTPPADGDNVQVTENITQDVTWSSDTTYELATRVSVTNGATLTIEPGTVIKGQEGQQANAKALVIADDGKINAVGTPDKPIIFTAKADNVSSGEIASPNTDPTQSGLWGGVIVLGKAPISAETNEDGQRSIEGIPTDDPTSFFGGSNPAHSSGTLKYISIRHGGTNIGQGNEINGLTLGGVGTGTTVEHIEVVANQDDGIECFGGTVNLSNTVVWNQEDDAYDMDQAYKGTLDNIIAVEGANSDHGFELDGPEGTQTGTYTLKNATIKGATGTDNQYADLRDGCQTNLENIYFFNFPADATFEINDKGTSENYLNNGTVTLKNIEINVSHLSSGNTTIPQIFKADTVNNNERTFTTLTFEEKAPDASIVSGPEDAGADKAPLQWTWAAEAGALSDL